MRYGKEIVGLRDDSVQAATDKPAELLIEESGIAQAQTLSFSGRSYSILNEIRNGMLPSCL